MECSAEGQTVRVNAGETARLTADGKLAVEPFTAQDIPAFVRDDADPGLTGGMDGTREKLFLLCLFPAILTVDLVNRLKSERTSASA